MAVDLFYHHDCLAAGCWLITCSCLLVGATASVPWSSTVLESGTLVWGYTHASFLLSSSSCFFQKVCWAGLLEGPWLPDGFSRGCLLLSLNLFSFTPYFSFLKPSLLSYFVHIVFIVYVVYIFYINFIFYSELIYIYYLSPLFFSLSLLGCLPR